MAKYKFRLEVVRQVRKRKEEEKLKALAQEKTRFQNAINRRNSLIADLNESLIRRESAILDKAYSARFAIEEDFISGTKERILRNDREIDRAKKRFDLAFKEYLNARRKVKALDKLDEKDFEKFKKEKTKKEMAALDEIYITRRNVGGSE